MPEARHETPSAPASDLAADLAGIDALVDRLVPTLTARLATTHLGELEVRRAGWRIRLRRPAGAGWNGELRRATDRAGDRGARASGQLDGHGHARPTSDAPRVATAGGSNGTGVTAGTGAAAAAIHVDAPSLSPRPAHEDESRRVATSPAVGVFRPGSRTAIGTRVREGDVLGHIDVLGVPQDVPAPVDGMVTELLVEGGTAVEYGQELILVAIAATADAGRR